mgnify:CR=1 FL=1
MQPTTHFDDTETVPTASALPVGAHLRSWAIRLLCVVLLFISAIPEALGQSESGSIPEAAPYEDDEFPELLRDLRRAEIIAVGAFPLVLAFTSLSYDTYRWLDQSVQRGELAAEYRPWIFAPPEKVPFSEDERRNLLIASGVLSLGLAAIDYVLGEMAIQ